jgi:hypothetical protein
VQSLEDDDSIRRRMSKTRKNHQNQIELSREKKDEPTSQLTTELKIIK